MKSFKVSNFRLFGSDGATIAFNPVTIFTGANSSGKSSFVKALIAFRNYMDGIINDFKKDGSYDLLEHYLDLSDPQLKISGFKEAMNRKANADDCMSFTMEVFPMFSSNGQYFITYSFQITDGDDNLNQGEISSLTVKRGEDEILRIDKERLAERGDLQKVNAFNINNSILSDFISFCRFIYLPWSLLREYSFDEEKAKASEKAKRLANIQGNEIATFLYAPLISNRLTMKDLEEYPALLTEDLWDSIEKCIEHNLLFYFPVLERFIGKSKIEAIQILSKDCNPSLSLSVIRNECDFFDE